MNLYSLIQTPYTPDIAKEVLNFKVLVNIIFIILGCMSKGTIYNMIPLQLVIQLYIVTFLDWISLHFYIDNIYRCISKLLS